MAADFPGEVGIALITPERDTVCVNCEFAFPMFSVVKFHQALAVSEALRSRRPLSTYDIKVTPEDLKLNTWSPMCEKYPGGGIFSVQQLMAFALVESDNNACDILFNSIVSPEEVQEYIHGLGIEECGIAWTEDAQHADINRCYGNWTTPLAAAQLMGWFYDNRAVDEHSRFVWDTMAGCKTGADRIPKHIADQCSCIVHKTGTGGPLPDGKVMGINDVACVVLPDGRHFELAVFVKDAACSPADCEALIAAVAAKCSLTF